MDMEYGQRKQVSRREAFLDTIMKMYLLQVWFNLADKAVEEQIQDSYAMRKFMGIDLTEEGAPDATTLLDFRQLLERDGLQNVLFETINEVLEAAGNKYRRALPCGCLLSVLSARDYTSALTEPENAHDPLLFLSPKILFHIVPLFPDIFPVISYLPLRLLPLSGILPDILCGTSVCLHYALCG